MGTKEVSETAVEKVIFDGLTEIGAEGEVTRAATFEDLDLDSLDLVELAQIIEDECGVELDGDAVKDVQTVGDVVELVITRAGGASDDG